MKHVKIDHYKFETRWDDSWDKISENGGTYRALTNSLNDDIFDKYASAMFDFEFTLAYPQYTSQPLYNPFSAIKEES